MQSRFYDTRARMKLRQVLPLLPSLLLALFMQACDVEKHLSWLHLVHSMNVDCCIKSEPMLPEPKDWEDAETAEFV